MRATNGNDPRPLNAWPLTKLLPHAWIFSYLFRGQHTYGSTLDDPQLIDRSPVDKQLLAAWYWTNAHSDSAIQSLVGSHVTVR